MTTTHHEYRNFVFTIEYQAEEPAYTVTFPDFPEIITSGGTLASAFANACEAAKALKRSRDRVRI